MSEKSAAAFGTGGNWSSSAAWRPAGLPFTMHFDSAEGALSEVWAAAARDDCRWPITKDK